MLSHGFGAALPSVARATALDRLVQAQHLAALGLLPVPIDERVWRGLPSARTTCTDSSAVRTASVSARFGLEGLASVEGAQVLLPNLLRNTH